MADEKLTNRWLMVVAALVMQLCLGVLYSYSVFRGPLMKEVGFTVKQAGYPYMASLFFFAVGMIVAGRWQDKAGPKKVALFGGVLLAIGAGLAGVLYKTVGGLVFSYGVLGGLGVGLCVRHPDRHLHQVVPRHARNDHRPRGVRIRRRHPGLRTADLQARRLLGHRERLLRGRQRSC